jgi:predicted GNAT superfamily acetyltransferase
MRIRDLDTIDDFDAAIRLQHEVWGADYDDIVPRSQFVVAAKTCGILVGAEDESGRLVGCVFSVPGLRHGRIVQWSHLLGVVPEARGRALGLRLKLAQRRSAGPRRRLINGPAIRCWPPSAAERPSPRLRRRGLLDDVYGRPSALHRGVPTDRFIASWHTVHRTWRGARPGRSWRAMPASPRHRRCCGPARTERSAPARRADLSRDDAAALSRFQPTSRGCWEGPDWRWHGGGRTACLPHLLRAHYRVVDVEAGRARRVRTCWHAAVAGHLPTPTSNPNLVAGFPWELEFGRWGLGMPSSAPGVPAAVAAPASPAPRRSPPERRWA